MKRILFGGILTAFFVLLQPTSAPLADEKTPTSWEMVGDFKVLRVWKTAALELRYPEVAMLQLTEKSRIELQTNPLAFLQKYKIFEYTDGVEGQFEIRLTGPKAASKDPAFAVVVHDLGTYSAVGVYDVTEIRPH
jgi:hypothetical protein